MWQVEILWDGRWLAVQTGFPSRDEAEWAASLWKQRNQCFGDPFRAVQIQDEHRPATAGEMLEEAMSKG